MNQPANEQWIRNYPNLGTEQISTEAATSPEFFEQERDQVFRRSWLVVGRQQDVADSGDWFLKEVPSPKASVLVMRGEDGVIRAFYNTCKHRGSKLVHENCGSGVKGFSCPLHGWVYDSSGNLAFVPDENEFYQLDKPALGLTKINCEVWEGFIFINLDPQPQLTLKEFLGEIYDSYDGYFDGLEEASHYTVTADINWKLLFDVSVEPYHVFSIHPIHPVSDETEKEVGKPPEIPEIKLPHIVLHELHRLVTVPGNPFRPQSPVEQLMIKYGVVSSFTFPEPGEKPADLPVGVNPGNVPAWSFDVLGMFPNNVVLTGRGIYVTIVMWPEAVDKTFFDIRIYMKPVNNMAERICREAIIAMTRDVMREDFDHVEPQQSALSPDAIQYIQLSDQELAVRHGYAALRKVMNEGFRGELVK